MLEEWNGMELLYKLDGFLTICEVGHGRLVTVDSVRSFGTHCTSYFVMFGHIAKARSEFLSKNAETPYLTRINRNVIP